MDRINNHQIIKPEAIYTNGGRGGRYSRSPSPYGENRRGGYHRGDVSPPPRIGLTEAPVMPVVLMIMTKAGTPRPLTPLDTGGDIQEMIDPRTGTLLEASAAIMNTVIRHPATARQTAEQQLVTAIGAAAPGMKITPITTRIAEINEVTASRTDNITVLKLHLR